MSLSRYEIANYGIDKGKEKEGKTRVEKINNDNNNNKKAEKE